MIFDFILDFQVSTISALIIVAIVLEILFKEFLNSVKCQMWYACFLTNAGEYQISGGIKSSCYVEKNTVFCFLGWHPPKVLDICLDFMVHFKALKVRIIVVSFTTTTKH